MISTRKPGIIVRSSLNITLPNRSHKKEDTEFPPCLLTISILLTALQLLP